MAKKPKRNVMATRSGSGARTYVSPKAPSAGRVSVLANAAIDSAMRQGKISPTQAGKMRADVWGDVLRTQGRRKGKLSAATVTTRGKPRGGR